MKVFAAVLVLCSAVAFVAASGYGGGAAAPAAGGYSASIPAPPCPKNYLFSCQPSLTPAPCAQSAYGGGYGSSGAYSENVPTYLNVPVGYQGGATYGAGYGIVQGAQN